MNPDLERLVILQAIDLELKRLREQLAEGPRRVIAAEGAHAQAAAALAKAKEQLATEEALRRRQESDIADQRNRSARLIRQLDLATSTEQVNALQHEIGFAKETVTKLEDDELASMERTEAIETERALAASGLEMAASRMESERSRTAEMSLRNKAAVGALEVERTKLRAQFAANDAAERALATYDRVSKGKGTGVSEALDHKCSACQMMVRPQRWNDLTSKEHRDEIFTCETCGRLLFWDPRRDSPGEWHAGDRLSAARQG